MILPAKKTLFNIRNEWVCFHIMKWGNIKWTVVVLEILKHLNYIKLFGCPQFTKQKKKHQRYLTSYDSIRFFIDKI